MLVRSEGQRLLLEVPATSADIARGAAVTKWAACEWRRGTKSPGPVARAALWHAYGIPAHAWARVPMGTNAAPEPTNGHALADDELTEQAAATTSSPSSLHDTDALIAKLRRAASVKDLLPADIMKLADSEAKLLSLRHRMQRDQELLEDKIIREHPSWQRIRRTLAEVLAKHPLAAAEVAEALQRLDL